MVTGTRSGWPAVPAAPANSLILAQLSIVHASATIPQSVITDRRVPAGNGIVVLDDILVGTDSRYPAASPQITFLNASNVGTNLIPPGFSDLELAWYVRSDTNAVSSGLNPRLNHVYTPTYDSQIAQAQAATLAAAEQLAGTFLSLANVPALTATAGYFGQGEARIQNPTGAVGNKIMHSNYFAAASDATPQPGPSLWRGELR